jgi:5-methylcytosine-specific restriction endonuclease McrA
MPPSPEDQIKFLISLQRLLAEGHFVATYKYALLLALADISIEKGDDSGSSLPVAIDDIAMKFVNYYWRQSIPYAAGANVLVLRQSTGRQAMVIRVLAEARSCYGDSLATMIRQPVGAKLVDDVGRVVKTMPLWKLQTVGSESLDFLYPNEGHGEIIELRPGIAYSFRRFYELIGDLLRGAWLRSVRQLNLNLIGEATDLSEFLFGSERGNLAMVRPVLEDLQNGRCFYCRGELHAGTAEVDHFISWSRYPVDLGHNLVLADRRCNGKKRDRIPAYQHLCAWVERNQRYELELSDRLKERGIFVNLATTERVVHWAYAQTEAANGLTWFRGEELVPLSPMWRERLPLSP